MKKKEIIYIAFIGIKHHGVQKKINGQVTAWRSCGYKVTLITDLNCKSTFKRLFNRYKVLIKYFLFNHHPAASIYLRQTAQLPFYLTLLAKRKFSYEINADIFAEARNYSFSKRFFTKIFSHKINKKASSCFYVSSELKNRIHKDACNGFVFPNSLQTPPVTHKLPRNKNIVFVGNPNFSWQGFDIFIFIASQMPNYYFHVVGAKSGPILSNLKYHGTLTGVSYNKFMNTMDFAIGTLAFFRSGLREGSPLKVRDYVAFNLPFVIGYIDSDFSDYEFCLQIDPENPDKFISKINNFFILWNEKSIEIKPDSDFININRERIRAKLICTF